MEPNSIFGMVHCSERSALLLADKPLRSKPKREARLRFKFTARECKPHIGLGARPNKEVIETLMVFTSSTG
jgi:hypothetical protein